MNDPVTLTYLRYRIDLLDERHVTIYHPDGTRLVAGVQMSMANARAFVRGYRLKERLEQLHRETREAVAA